MKNKILILSLNSRYSHSCLAAYYLRTTINDLKMYQVIIKEMSINDNFNDIISYIFSEKPMVLAIPVYIWNKILTEAILSDIKKILKDLIIVLGGPEVSYNSKEFLDKYPELDYIISGAGEKAFYTLASASFSLPYRLIKIDNYPFNDIPFPYQSEDATNFKNKYIYYESSRGCPFKCSYCISSRSDQKLEYKNLDSVKKELTLLLDFKPAIIKFIDRSFNVHKDFALGLWDFLINLDTDCRFHFEIHPMYLDLTTINLLKKAKEGLFQFEIGVQSTNIDSLKEINRMTKWEDIADKLKMILELKNIHFHLDQIAGLPYEDCSSLKTSFNNIINLRPDHYQTGILKVLYGTDLYEKKHQYELVYSAFPPYKIYKNKWLSYEELSQYESVDHAIDLIYNSKYFVFFVNFLFDTCQDKYLFFMQLSQYFTNQKLPRNEKNFSHIFSLCAEFIMSFFNNSQTQTQALDLLRFDWALFNNTHAYPTALCADKSDEFKDNSWKEIKLHRKNEVSQIGDQFINLSELRRARFYKANNQSSYELIDFTQFNISSKSLWNKENIEGIIILDKKRLILW